MLAGFTLQAATEPILLSWIFIFIAYCQADTVGRQAAAAHVYAQLGSNASLPCPYRPETDADIVWVRDGRALGSSSVAAPGPHSQLIISDVTLADEGLYTCQPEGAASADSVYLVQLHVQRPPGALVGVRVQAHTVLAEVFWRVNDTGQMELTRVGLRYREAGRDRWQLPIPQHVAPTETHREVYHLRSNTSYEFEVWSENALGPGPVTRVQATTQPDSDLTDIPRGLLAEAVVLGSESWVTAVAVSLVVVLLVAAGGACVVLRAQREIRGEGGEGDNLVLHMEGPMYELEVLETGQRDENSNSQTTRLLNNNVEVHPVRI